MGRSETSRPYSEDAIWNLLDSAKALVQRAHQLCQDPDTERLTTALVLEAEDNIRDAMTKRFKELS